MIPLTILLDNNRQNMPFEQPPFANTPPAELPVPDANTVYALKREIETLPTDRKKLEALEQSLGDFIEYERKNIKDLPLPEGIDDYTLAAWEYRWQKLEEALNSPATLVGAIKAECDKLRAEIEVANEAQEALRKKAEETNRLIAQISELVEAKTEYQRIVGVDADNNVEDYDKKIARLQTELERLD